jgi:hypothetical protein
MIEEHDAKGAMASNICSGTGINNCHPVNSDLPMVFTHANVRSQMEKPSMAPRTILKQQWTTIITYGEHQKSPEDSVAVSKWERHMNHGTSPTRAS